MIYEFGIKSFYFLRSAN